MTRGALVLWVGTFSVLFLHHRLSLYQWASLAMVVSGVCIVGLSGVLTSDGKGSASTDASGSENSAANVTLGLLMVMLAQVFAALQFVSEERIMEMYDIEPILAVGLEGSFGASITLLAIPVLHYAFGRTPQGRGGYFDMVNAWHQIVNSPMVMVSGALFAASIASYNLLGLSVTRLVSATSRSTLDTCRSLGIWVVSIFLGWEALQPLSGLVQCLGFALLAYGTFVFNGLAPPPACLVGRESIGIL